MPRVAVPAQSEADAFGYVLTQLRPETGGAAAQFVGTAYARCVLSLREMEGARMMTALINGCQLCRDFRAMRDLPGTLAAFGKETAGSPVGRGEAVPEEDFYVHVTEFATWPGYSERERLAIEYAKRFGEAPQSLPHDETFWSRMKAVYSEEEIVDLTLMLGAWVALGRFAHVLNLDGAVCSIAPPQPLEAAA